MSREAVFQVAYGHCRTWWLRGEADIDEPFPSDEVSACRQGISVRRELDVEESEVDVAWLVTSASAMEFSSRSRSSIDSSSSDATSVGVAQLLYTSVGLGRGAGVGSESRALRGVAV